MRISLYFQILNLSLTLAFSAFLTGCNPEQKATIKSSPDKNNNNDKTQARAGADLFLTSGLGHMELVTQALDILQNGEKAESLPRCVALSKSAGDNSSYELSATPNCVFNGGKWSGRSLISIRVNDGKSQVRIQTDDFGQKYILKPNTNEEVSGTAHYELELTSANNNDKLWTLNGYIKTISNHVQGIPQGGDTTKARNYVQSSIRTEIAGTIEFQGDEEASSPSTDKVTLTKLFYKGVFRNKVGAESTLTLNLKDQALLNLSCFGRLNGDMALTQTLVNKAKTETSEHNLNFNDLFILDTSTNKRTRLEVCTKEVQSSLYRQISNGLARMSQSLF
jgi:hypothetical protein